MDEEEVEEVTKSVGERGEEGVGEERGCGKRKKRKREERRRWSE